MKILVDNFNDVNYNAETSIKFVVVNIFLDHAKFNNPNISPLFHSPFPLMNVEMTRWSNRHYLSVMYLVMPLCGTNENK